MTQTESGNIVHKAEFCQGGEDYPNIDRYNSTTLSPGTQLVKLEPSKSGYFTTLEEFQKLKRDAKVLSEGVQLAPRRQFLPNGERAYDYRPEVSVWSVQKPIIAAEGSTLANIQYGEGKLPQVYIADYQANSPTHNQEIGLQHSRNEPLQNTRISISEGDLIYNRRDFQLLKRNQFCYLDQQHELLKLRSLPNKPILAQKLEEKLNDVTTKANRLGRRITFAPEMNKLPSPSYDEKITYVKSQIASQKVLSASSPPLKNDNLDTNITSLRQNLLTKVQNTITQVVSGELPYGNRNQEIHVDELRKAYEADQFVKNARCIHNLGQNSGQVDDVGKQISAIDGREKELLRLGKLMNVLEENAPLAQKAEQKVFFKKAFMEKHAPELSAYTSAKSELTAHGIHSRPDLQRHLDQFNAQSLPQRNRLQQELKGLDYTGKELRTELNALTHHHFEYQQFLDLGKEQSLSGSKMPLSM